MNHTLRSIYKSLLLVSVFLCLCVPARSAAPPSDFKVRAFYLDCRTQVMTVSAIKEHSLSKSMPLCVINWHSAAAKCRIL